MKLFITDISAKKRLFYCVVNGKKEAFYLSNRLAKTFFPVLEKGMLVDFEVSNRSIKKHGDTTYFVYPVLYFNTITQLNPKKEIYNLKELRKDMKSVLTQYEYFLFLDCEMSMPGYKQTKFTPEIIQVGFILSDINGKVYEDMGYYVLPNQEDAINKRTIKFLNLDELEFFGKAKPYHVFYHDLKKLMEKYNPKIVVWGKNDIQAINLGYLINEVEPVTHEKDFIDLLKLHKDYFNLQNDIKLFDAYKKYYNADDSLVQDHNARTDAIITKDVFDAFLNQM